MVDENNCNNCNTDCTDESCDYIGSRAVTIDDGLANPSNCGLTDGLYNNATVVVTGGCITSVYSGEGLKYIPPICGGSIVNTGGSVPVQGPPGQPGNAATITVNPTVINLPYGQQAHVENTGTPTSAYITFSIPSGPSGDTGGVSNNYNASNNVLTVEKGLVTDITTFVDGGGFINSLEVDVINGNNIAASTSRDALNPGSVRITIDVKKINDYQTANDANVTSLTSAQGEFSARLSALEDKVNTLIKG